MPGSIWSWSLIAANNDLADADINWQEGQFPDTVNDSARAMMQRVAEFRSDLGGVTTVGGNASAMTITAKSAFTAFADGLIVGFKATASNTGAVTVNVNNLGAKAIRRQSTTGDVALTGNEIRAGGRYVLTYDTAANGASGAWLLLNPSLPGAAYSLAASSTLNAVPRFSDTTGGTKNSGVIVDDSNNLSGIGTLTAGNLTATGNINGNADINFTPPATSNARIRWNRSVSGAGFAIRDDTAAADRLSIDISGNVTVGSGAIYLPDGSASAPAFSFSGDTNTGFYRPLADTLTATTGGVARFTIGTTAISMNLPISSSAAATFTTLTVTG